MKLDMIFKEPCLLFYPNVPGATLIPESRVSRLRLWQFRHQSWHKFDFYQKSKITKYFLISFMYISRDGEVARKSRNLNFQSITSVTKKPDKILLKNGILLPEFSDLLWEIFFQVIEKKFWNSRLKAKNLQNFWDH